MERAEWLILMNIKWRVAHPVFPFFPAMEDQHNGYLESVLPQRKEARAPSCIYLVVDSRSAILFPCIDRIVVAIRRIVLPLRRF
jgi:hypothetical protein